MREMTSGEQALAFRFAHSPLPPEAIDCEPWLLHGGEDWRRLFLIREWEIAGIWVSVAGTQDHRGQVRRWMHVGGQDQCDSSDRARLVATILEAGQLLDSLNQGADVPTVASRV